MVSVCLPSDALLQHLPSYLGFSYLGSGISLHGHSSKAQPLLLTLDEGYLLTAAPPDLEHRIAPLGPPVPMQPLLLGCGVAPPSCRPWPQAWSSIEITLPTKVCLVKAMAFPLVMFQEPGAAERSYPTSEVRGGSREEQPHLQGAVAAWAQEG